MALCGFFVALRDLRVSIADAEAGTAARLSLATDTGSWIGASHPQITLMDTDSTCHGVAGGEAGSHHRSLSADRPDRRCFLPLSLSTDADDCPVPVPDPVSSLESNAMHATNHLPAVSQRVWKRYSPFVQTADLPWPGR